ncbi:MAG: hypothetical protein JEY96_16670 [Bacteroidales bacterium]|nr:hypothetical protein [Bacteroidales bacterium]
MKKTLYTILIIIFCFLNVKSQSILVKGHVIEYKSKKPIGEINIRISDSSLNENSVFSDSETGYFELLLDDRLLLDSLILTGLTNYRPLVITNIPNDKDVINLDSVPMFGELYWEAIPMWNFQCHPLNIFCKVREFFYGKKIGRNIKRINKEADKNASECIFFYENENYLFDYSEYIIELDLKYPVRKE